MDSSKQNALNLEIFSPKRDKNMHLQRNDGVCPSLRRRNMDIEKKVNKSLNGCYTRMLRKGLNVSWKQHLTNLQLYETVPPVSSTIRQRRLKFAGHSVRQKDQNVSKLVLWGPTHGTKSKGGQSKTFVDTQKEGTGCTSAEEIKSCMEERDVWRKIVSRCSVKNVDR